MIPETTAIHRVIGNLDAISGTVDSINSMSKTFPITSAFLPGFLQQKSHH
jgi:hypothetical protein